ncbi:MAG: hypothetical protein OER82_03865 [Nitrosopumilus sp.]|nr:hypothetical protein [Nitrosopumilus sp.]
MRRFIYGEDPASKNDFHGITIHELPETTMDDETPMPLLRDISATRNHIKTRANHRGNMICLFLNF